MIKIFLSGSAWREVWLTGAFSCAFALSALAQNASPASQIGPGSAASVSPAKGIGPAPVNTKQHQILTGALSLQTRQTLQEAMDSARTADSAQPVPPAK